MKVLGVPILTPYSPQSGLRKAMEGLSTVGTDNRYCEFDWKGLADTVGLPEMRKQFKELVTDLKPDISFAQIQTADILTDELAEVPGFKVHWTGDVRQPLPSFYRDIARNVTVSTFSNTTDVDVMVAEGYDARYLQCGFSDDVFVDKGYNRTYGIVFMGNYYSGQFPLSEARKEMVNNLRKTWGSGFQVYGNNWHRDIRWKCEFEECEKYNRAKIAVIQSHFNNLGRYSSDRLWRAMGCGIFCLVNHYPGIELEFEIGKHLDTWVTLDELNQKIEYYLEHQEERERIAKAGCELVHSRDTWRCRMDTVLEWYNEWKAKAPVKKRTRKQKKVDIYEG